MCHPCAGRKKKPEGVERRRVGGKEIAQSTRELDITTELAPPSAPIVCRDQRVWFGVTLLWFG